MRVFMVCCSSLAYLKGHHFLGFRVGVFPLGPRHHRERAFNLKTVCNWTDTGFLGHVPLVCFKALLRPSRINECAKESCVSLDLETIVRLALKNYDRR